MEAVQLKMAEELQLKKLQRGLQQDCQILENGVLSFFSMQVALYMAITQIKTW